MNIEIDFFKKILIYSLIEVTEYLKEYIDNYKNNYYLKETKPIVFNENIAYYENELVCFNKIVEKLNNFDFSEINSFDNAKKKIVKEVEKIVESEALSKNFNNILKDKLDLVENFSINYIKKL